MRYADGREVVPSKRYRLLELQQELRLRVTATFPDDALLFACRKCDQVRLVTDFDLVGRNKYGLNLTCRVCKDAARTTFPPQMEGERKCRLCSEEKPITDFSIDRRKKTGRGSRCKACVSRSVRERSQARDGVVDETVLEFRKRQTLRLVLEEGLNDVPDHQLKRCSRCRAVKPLAGFYVSFHSSDRRYPHCSECDEKGKKRGKENQKA